MSPTAQTTLDDHRPLLVLTAANEAQARGYRAQLQHRRRHHLMEAWSDAVVVADPGGRRVGSGGSTLWVLHQIAARLLEQEATSRTPRRQTSASIADLFRQRQIVIVHSGGDSRRLCAYAAQGKAFTPLPCDIPRTPAGGQAGGFSPGSASPSPTTSTTDPATLFDLIADSLVRLPRPAAGHVLIAAGDVLLTFDPGDVDFHADPAGLAVTGVAYPGTADRARRHGVYVVDRLHRVTGFLQKPDAPALHAAGAIDSVGRVLIDTGLLSLTPDTVAHWLHAAGVRTQRRRLFIRPRSLLADLLDGSCPAIDLYEQMLIALSPALDRRAYLDTMRRSHTGPAGRSDAGHQRRLSALYQALHQTPFRCSVLPYCDFFHIGSSAELLGHIDSLSRTARTYGFANLTRSVVPDGVTLDRSFIYNTIIESSRLAAGPGVMIEASHITGPVRLPGRNLVVGWPRDLSAPLDLPVGWGAVALPVGRRHHALVLFGIDDDFKTPIPQSGVQAGGSGPGSIVSSDTRRRTSDPKPPIGTVGNIPLREFLDRHHLHEADLWPRSLPPNRRTLWEARLWPVAPIRRAYRLIAWMLDRRRAGSAPAAWRGARRRSMAELILQVDHARLIDHRADIQRRHDLARLDRHLLTRPDRPAAEVLGLLRSLDDARLALRGIRAATDRHDDPLLHARSLRLAELVLDRHPAARDAAPALAHAAHRGGAFAAVARSVTRDLILPDQPRPAAILHDQVVWVATPVRIDFAGGWSDTPPICAEVGGAVLNAAITLNGQYPVQVVAKRSEEPVVTLASIDLGRREVIDSIDSVAGYTDPSRWSALPKAALVLAGVCPDPGVAARRSPRRGEPLRRWLEQLGGGLDITIFSALPKGSGLGTSSVLGAAMLACLARAVGEPLSTEDLIARTSLLEQMMTTGGGWQDQVGGVTPGVKLIRTQPGADQTPAIHRAAFDFAPGSDLRRRTLLYFTGIKRMARDILQKVVGRYLAREPESLRIIDRLKRGALSMKTALDAGDLDAFAAGVDEYWRLKKALDPGSTNPRIEALLRPIDRYLSARLLPGAGGGGFVFAIARDADAARKVRNLLTANPPNPHARFFDLDIDPHGLRVTVL